MCARVRAFAPSVSFLGGACGPSAWVKVLRLSRLSWLGAAVCAFWYRLRGWWWVCVGTVSGSVFAFLGRCLRFVCGHGFGRNLTCIGGACGMCVWVQVPAVPCHFWLGFVVCGSVASLGVGWRTLRLARWSNPCEGGPRGCCPALPPWDLSLVVGHRGSCGCGFRFFLVAASWWLSWVVVLPALVGPNVGGAPRCGQLVLAVHCAGVGSRLSPPVVVFLAAAPPLFFSGLTVCVSFVGSVPLSAVCALSLAP